MRKLSQYPIITSFLLGLLVFLSILGLRYVSVLADLELRAYDALIRSRPKPTEPDARVVLITIGDKDIKGHLQDLWPPADQILAQTLTLLAQYQARAIGLDLYRYFSEPPGQEELEAAFKNNPRIIAITKFGAKGEDPIPPPPVLQETEQTGFNDFIVDRGGTVHRGLLFLDDGENFFYSLALRLALLYLQEEGISLQPDADNPAHLRLGRSTIRPFEANDGGYVGADARGYQFLLDFQGAPAPQPPGPEASCMSTFRCFSLTQLLTDQVPPAAIRDKVVLIGVAVGENVKDYFFTPYSHGQQGEKRMAGMDLHAHSVSQLLRAALEGQALIKTLSDRYEALWLLVWSVLGAVMGLWARSLWRFSLVALAGLLLLVGIVYSAFVAGWWLPGVPPALAWLCATALITSYLSNQEKEQRTLLMDLFSRHVSPEVAETIWERREQIFSEGRLRPQRLTATVLFSDIVGFTPVSEKLPPQELMDWLNAYMDIMAQQVIDHGGIIDKYIGDSVMAIFGAPLPRSTEKEFATDATNAVRCALAMGQALHHMNRRWQEQGLPAIGMRVGIFTGPLVTGHLGSEKHVNYTVIGDTVNTASRLESYDKNVLTPDPLTNPCRILVGSATAAYLNGQFALEHAGEVSLKGKDERVAIYHVPCLITKEKTI